MPHIELPEELPGIRSLFAYRSDTGQLLSALAETLLRKESPISTQDRELIAAFVSHGNECLFCTNSHAAASRELFGDRKEIVDQVLEDFRKAPLSPKMKALLEIAGKVRENGLHVTDKHIEDARNERATDREIHDTVLIAAAFSMYNRYVDGLATRTPADGEIYKEMGKVLAEQGYQRK